VLSARATLVAAATGDEGINRHALPFPQAADFRACFDYPPGTLVADREGKLHDLRADAPLREVVDVGPAHTYAADSYQHVARTRDRRHRCLADFHAPDSG